MTRSTRLFGALSGVAAVLLGTISPGPGASATSATLQPVQIDATPSDPREYSAAAPAISSDGRYVAFISDSPSLVLGDTNGYSDVFVADLLTGERERVSVGTTGVEGNNNVQFEWTGISSTGRYVTFASHATNLVEGTLPGLRVYVRDRLDQTTELISPNSTGYYAANYPSISGDGRYVVFSATADDLVAGSHNVYLRDRATGQLTGLPNSTAQETRTEISTDGRFVSYQSADFRIRVFDVFAGTGVDPVDSQGAPLHGSGRSCLSADGRFLAFVSIDSSPNLYVLDRNTGQLENESVLSDGTALDRPSQIDTNGCISSDGNTVVFESNADNVSTPITPSQWNVLVRDRAAGTLTAMPAFRQTDPAVLPAQVNATVGVVSGDGQTFASQANSFVAPSVGTYCPFISLCLEQNIIVYTDDFADRTPPTLSIPGDLLVPTTGHQPVIVTYAASASDDGSGLAGPATCIPASGSSFAVGTTVVTCSAMDNAGNTASKTFEINVAAQNAVAHLEPTMTCVVDNPDGSHTAYFGYVNPTTASVYIPVGASNRFNPGVDNLGQPATFAPGPHPSVVTITFTRAALTWQLDGRAATANPGSERC